MIQANELRIGNLASTLGVAIVITADHIKAISEGDSMYKPIPLTPEILEKAGFKNRSQKSDYCFERGEVIIGGTMKRMALCYWSESGLFPISNEIKLVHQLQNLYHALTGEELKIEL